MRKRRSPQEKKRLSYRKDHVEATGESRHGFRRSWPKKKARAHRAERRVARERIDAAVGRGDADALLLGASRGKRAPRKWGASPLGEHLAERQERRIRRAGDRVSRRNQQLADHLRQLLLHHPDETPHLRRIASFLKKFIRADAVQRRHIKRSLYVFFHDRPGWEERAKRWLALH